MALTGSFRNDYRRDLKLEIKVDEFSRFLRDFERQLRGAATMREITDYEVSRIMERAIKLTGKASTAKMRSKVGGLRLVTVDGMRQPLFNKKTGRPQRFSDEKWAKITKAKKDMLARLLRARGLSAQSWYLLARLIGYDVKAPAYVRSAVPVKDKFSGIQERGVSIRRDQNGNGRYGLEITNRMPKLQFRPPGGYQALFSAIAGRIGFFKRNMQKGVFNDAKAVAAKYKGITVTTGI